MNCTCIFSQTTIRGIIISSRSTPLFRHQQAALLHTSDAVSRQHRYPYEKRMKDRYAYFYNDEREILGYGKRGEGGWEQQNKQIFPPQQPGEEPRLAEFYYSRRGIRYSPRKMWYLTNFIRFMWVDEALLQLRYIKKKGALLMRDILSEAQELAVKEQNIEYKSNIHIAQAFVGKGEIIKNPKSYEWLPAKNTPPHKQILQTKTSHCFLLLKEGPPPEKQIETTYDKAKEYVAGLRERTLYGGLEEGGIKDDWKSDF